MTQRNPSEIIPTLRGPDARRILDRLREAFGFECRPWTSGTFEPRAGV